MFAATLGWISTLGTIGAYVMLSRGHWTAASLRYSVLNMAGGLLGAFGSAAYGAWPSVASNLIWAAVSLNTIAVILRSRRRPALSIVPEPDPEPFEPIDTSDAQEPLTGSHRMHLSAA